MTTVTTDTRTDLPNREEIVERVYGVTDKRDVRDVLSRLTPLDLAAEMQRRGASVTLGNRYITVRYDKLGEPYDPSIPLGARTPEYERDLERIIAAAPQQEDTAE